MSLFSIKTLSTSIARIINGLIVKYKHSIITQENLFHHYVIIISYLLIIINISWNCNRCNTTTKRWCWMPECVFYTSSSKLFFKRSHISLITIHWNGVHQFSEYQYNSQDQIQQFPIKLLI